MTKLLSVVGARPQFIKLAPFLRSIESWNATNTPAIQHLSLHTGQHYDKGMSEIFFEELEMPTADINLGVGSGSHGAQTAKMLEGIEQVLMKEKPEMVVIFGDTNSTVAAALAAVKLHIPVAHIEAGLRSYNRQMPEEINRIVSDHISEILFAPTPTAVHNLEQEGLKEKTVLSGDIMYDTVLLNKAIAARKSDILSRLSLSKGTYCMATVHRAENTDDPSKLGTILDIFNQVAAKGIPLIFPIHPRTRNRIGTHFPNWEAQENLKIIEPIGYLDMLQLAENARLAFTDSGGLQKEVFFLNCPCITLREETEWVETVSAGGNILTGANEQKILAALQEWETRLEDTGELDFSGNILPYFGNGKSADLTLETIMKYLNKIPAGMPS